MPFQMRTLSVPPISKLGKLAIVSMVIEAIVIIILEAYVANSFLKSDQSDSNKGIPVYLLLFVTAQLFANGLVVDFVRTPPLAPLTDDPGTLMWLTIDMEQECDGNVRLPALPHGSICLCTLSILPATGPAAAVL